MNKIITLLALMVSFAITDTKAQTIAGTVWLDDNGNGLFDGGEPGISGVEVTLLNSPALTVAMGPIATNGAGAYSFTGMAPGNYVVRFNQLPANPNYVFTRLGGDSQPDRFGNHDTPPFTFSGPNIAGIDAGLFLVASVGDRVWEDINGNGIQDDGTATLPSGVNVTLYDVATGSPVTNDAFGPIPNNPINTTGAYTFQDLFPGNYYIVFEEPGGANGLHLTLQDATADGNDSDADQVTGQVVNFTLTSDESIDHVDAGYYLLGSIGDVVWHDTDGDGINEGEGPLPSNVTITLLDGTGTPVAIDGLGNPVTPISTNNMYLFDNLIPGDYIVNFNEPGGPAPGLHLTLADYSGGNTDGTDGIDDSDADETSGDSHVITISSNEQNDRIDAGYFILGSIGNFTWYDCDGDGRQSSGEPGLSGVTISITDDMGNPVVDPTTGANIGDQISDGSGNYIFQNLPPGDYKLTFTAPANHFPTIYNIAGGPDDNTDSDIDSDVDPDNTNMTFIITIDSDEDEIGIDAGFYEPVTLGDFVWHDADADGIQDAGEQGRENVQLNIEFSDGSTTTDIFNNPINPVFSDALGLYQFQNLRPGSYNVIVTPPAMWFFSDPDQTGDTADSDFDMTGNIVTPIVLNNCTNPGPITTVDAGIYKNITVGGTVWAEGDDNGNQDAGENGAMGIEVEIYDSNGTLIGTDITDANGDYSFMVKPGNYYIWVTSNNFGPGNPLNGLISCTPTEDPNNNVDLDDNGTGGNLGPIFTGNIELLCGGELGPDGTDNLTIDFCFRYDCNSQNGLAALSCETVTDTFCNLFDLDIGCARMPSTLIPPFPSPLCPGGNNVANNMSWFAFVAGNGNYTLEVEPFGCVPGGGGNLGVQAGIYTDCTFSEAVFCDGSCHTNAIDISSNVLTPGNVYFFFFDGCSGSVCSYNINILGDFQEYTVPDPTDVSCISGDCTDVCPGTDVTVQVNSDFDNLNGSFHWIITNPNGSLTMETTDINQLSHTLTDLGTYTFTIDKIVTKCSTTDLDQTFQITVKNPDNEDFGMISECQNFFPPPGPGSVDNAGIITDPNNDGNPGWNSNAPLVEGMNLVHINDNGCEYDQEVEVIKLLNSETSIDLVLCPADLPYSIAGTEITTEILVPTPLFLPNEAGCDSIINLTALILSVDGHAEAVGCVPGGYLIKYVIDGQSNYPGVNIDVVWKDINDVVITDGDPDFDPKTIIVTSTGIYHPEVVITYSGLNGAVNCQPVLSNNISVDFATLLPAPPTGTGVNTVCETNPMATYTAETTETGATFNWTWPSDVASAVGQGTNMLIIDWTGSAGGDVCVAVTNSCGTSTPLCQTVAVTPIPVAAIDAQANTCIDSLANVTFTATQIAGATYSWNFNGGTIENGASGAGPYEVSWPDAGIKNVTVTINKNGCISTQAIDSVLVVGPVAPPEITCESSLGQVTFTWVDPPGFTGYMTQITTGQTGGVLMGNSLMLTGLPEGDSVALVLTTATNSPCGSLVSFESCIVQSCVPPDVNITAVSPICVDATTQAITLQAIITPTSNGSGVFSGSPAVTPGGIFDPKLVPLTNGQGTVTINYNYTDPDGCKNNDNIMITVNAIPTADFTVVDTICELNTSTIDYNGSVVSGGTYVWDFAGGSDPNVSSGPGPYNVAWSSPGLKNVTLTVTKSGCTSPQFSLPVLVEPKLESVQVNCVNQLPTAITFGWNSVDNSQGFSILVDGAPFTVTDTTYSLTGLTPETSHFIEVLALSDNKCPDVKDTITCYAVNCPTTNIMLSIPDTVICLTPTTGTLDLNATITGGLGTGNGVELWSGAGIDPATGIFNPTTAGNGLHIIDYLFTEGACVTPKSVKITVVPQPKSTFTAVDKICETDDLLVDYTGSPSVPLNWQLGTGVTVSPNGTNKYKITFPSDGNYTIGLLTGNANCLSEISNLNVQVDPKLDTVKINCTSTLNSVSFTWNDIECATDYQITVNGLSQGTQNNLNLNVTGLAEGDDVNLQILPITECACPAIPSAITCTAKACPSVVIQPTADKNDFCMGDIITPFQVNPNVTGSETPGNGTWSGTGVSPTGMFDPTNLGAGLYTLSYAYTESNCPFTGEIDINILPNPTITVDPTNPTCYLDNFGSAQAFAEGGAGNYTYILDGNGIALSDLNSLEPKAHILVVKDEKGCDALTNFVITPAKPAEMNIQGSTLIKKGNASTLTANVTQLYGAQLDSISWESNNGGTLCTNCPVLNYSPLEDDTYCATLHYNDGCNIKECLDIRVQVIIDIIFPNVFTPASASENNYFYVPNYENILLVKDMSIFDRWGNKVFQNSGFVPGRAEDGWNGKLNSNAVLPGVYVYKVDLVLTNLEEKTFTGDLTVVR